MWRNPLFRLYGHIFSAIRERALHPYVVLELESLGVILDKVNILPENILSNNNNFYLFYTDRNVKPHKVGVAKSKDMLEWEDLGLILIHGNEKFILDAPHIMKQNDGYYLFFSRVDDSTTLMKRIYVAYSDNVEGPYKLLVKKPILNVGGGGDWDGGRVDEPFVIYDGKFFHMLYMGAPLKNINIEQVGYASANRVEGPWIKSGCNPVLKFGLSYDEFTIADPSILKWEDSWLIFYACSGRITGAKSYGSSPWLTAVANTKDFKTYKKLGLVKIRSKDSFKHRSYFRGSFIIKNEELYFVYAGQDYQRTFYPMLAKCHISALNRLPLN
jgi:predicted GH43/DUF377 family glycosyl hydrolase